MIINKLKKIVMKIIIVRIWINKMMIRTKKDTKKELIRFKIIQKLNKMKNNQRFNNKMKFIKMINK